MLDAQEITDPAGAVLGHGTERTVDQQLRAKGTGPHFSFCLAHVPIARPDVHDRTDAASVFGRECACVDIRIGQGVGIKDAEQANAVKGVVDEHSVQKYFVLDGGTSSDVQLPTLVSCRNKSWQHLQGLDQIRRASKTRDALDVCGTNGLHGRSDLGGLLLSLGRHLGTPQGHHLRGQQHIDADHLAILDGHWRPVVVVLQAGDHKGVLARRNPTQRVVPVQITADPIGRPFQGHRCKHDGLSRVFRLQKPLHCALRPQHGGGHQHPRQPKRSNRPQAKKGRQGRRNFLHK